MYFGEEVMGFVVSEGAGITGEGQVCKPELTVPAGQGDTSKGWMWFGTGSSAWLCRALILLMCRCEQHWCVSSQWQESWAESC